MLSTLSSTEPLLERKSMPRKSMHITCLTIGSRGDVQPYIALCKQLIKDGHQCRIASHGEYKSWVEEHGIEFRSIGGDPGELMVRMSFYYADDENNHDTMLYIETLH